MLRLMLGVGLLSWTVTLAGQGPMEVEAERLIREADEGRLSVAARSEAYARAFALSAAARTPAPRVTIGDGFAQLSHANFEAFGGDGLDALSLRARAIVGLLHTTPAVAIRLLDSAAPVILPRAECHPLVAYSDAPRYAMWAELLSFFWPDAQPNPYYADEARMTLRLFARELARIDSSSEAGDALATLALSELPDAALGELLDVWAARLGLLAESRWTGQMHLPRLWPLVQSFADRLNARHRRSMARTIASAFGRYFSRHLEDQRCLARPAALIPFELYVARDVNRLLQQSGLPMLMAP